MMNLYVKTHNVTGLKYLGKTVQDPYTYEGSGKYWKLHINKHGYDVTTEILGSYDDKKDLKVMGEFYSKIWDIVESDQWANLKEECGDGGAQTDLEVLEKLGRSWRGKPAWNKGLLWNDETKKKMSIAKKGKPTWNKGKTDIYSEDTKKKMGLSNKGKKRSDETKRKIGQAQIGRKFSEETKEKMKQAAYRRIEAKGINHG